MEISRREFVGVGMAGLAGLYTGGAGADMSEAVSAGKPGEDGYKLWLRYVAPGPIAAEYRQLVRQILVEGDFPRPKSFALN